jgi:hypothetical protein
VSRFPPLGRRREERQALMRHTRLAVTALAVAAMGTSAAVAGAATPTPVPETPSCDGQIVATYNHESGVIGAAGTETSSAGPGYFLRQSTQAEIEAVRAFECG